MDDRPSDDDLAAMGAISLAQRLKSIEETSAETADIVRGIETRQIQRIEREKSIEHRLASLEAFRLWIMRAIIYGGLAGGAGGLTWAAQ